MGLPLSTDYHFEFALNKYLHALCIYLIFAIKYFIIIIICLVLFRKGGFCPGRFCPRGVLSRGGGERGEWLGGFVPGYFIRGVLSYTHINFAVCECVMCICSLFGVSRVLTSQVYKHV